MEGISRHSELDVFRRKERKIFRTNRQAVSPAPVDNPTPANAAISISDILSARKRKLGAAFRDCHANEESITSVLPARKFVVGLDYGTTFTSVSYYIHDIDDPRPRALPWDVKHISNWPDAGTISASANQVPSESWHSAIPIDRTMKKQAPSNRNGSEEMGRDNGNGDGESVDTDSELDGDRSTEYLWGYAVPFQQYSANTTRSTLGLVKYAKSQLLDTSYTEKDRTALGPILADMVRRDIIRKHGKRGALDARDVHDVIADFLTKVFIHTKEQLVTLHGYTDECKVQFVITVPTIWSPQSSRVLQSCMEAAIRGSGFGALGNGAIDNLYIISEPEAAGTWLLTSSEKMMPGETFVILDCGGGTVDAVTYTANSAYPLRLGREEVEPDGDNCGASYLNENYKNILENRIRLESYLFENGETKESIVARLIPKFEEVHKRRVDITKRCGDRIYIAGLVGDAASGEEEKKRFDNGHLLFQRQDYQEAFLPLLERVEDVLVKQLDLAYQKGKPVKTVFLVGGFGASPSLRSYLANCLKEISQVFAEMEAATVPREIRLSLPAEDKDSVTAVSAGAVLRALDMRNGPDRIIKSSYGFLRTEPHEPDVYPQHSASEPYLNELDGEHYLQTIVFFMAKVCTLSPTHMNNGFEPIDRVRRFLHTTNMNPFLLTIHLKQRRRDFSARRFCSCQMWPQSPTSQSTTRKIQAEFKSPGEILTDMTWLRDRKIIKPVQPASGYGGKKHYRVEYELVAIVEGRNLRYEARYPAGEGGEVQRAKQVSIAAAFKPGTN